MDGHPSRCTAPFQPTFVGRNRGVIHGFMVKGMALSAIARNIATARAEVRILVATIRDEHVNSTDHTGIDTATMVESLSRKLRSADSDSVFLGDGPEPVTVTATAAVGRGTNDGAIGAGTAQRFVLTTGSADFPLITSPDCENILSIYDNQKPHFRGFQLRVATSGGAVEAVADTNFSVKSASGTRLAGVGEATADNGYYAAKSYALRDVQASHMTHACEKAPDLDAGAIINLAFLCSQVRPVRR